MPVVAFFTQAPAQSPVLHMDIIDPRERKHHQRDRCPVEQLPCFSRVASTGVFPFSRCDWTAYRPGLCGTIWPVTSLFEQVTDCNDAILWCATFGKSTLDIVVYMNAPVYVSFGALI